VHDPEGATIFTGGGSKDDLDVPSWQHKSGSVPPKDEIEDAMAALYEVPEPGGDQHLYFAADRFANNGSADFGFWFFRNKISLNADGTFSGVHAVGDILILGTFTQGGATTTIRVFEWTGTTVTQTDVFGDCVPGSSGDQGCGTVNSATEVAPWPYTPKFGTAGTFPSGSFFEGGVNLTELGLAGCFQSFLAETRSSPSIDATLKDFVLGEFQPCATTLVTTPKDGNGNNIPAGGLSIGTGSVQVKDSALLTVSGTSDWEGSLEFRLCGPILAPATCTTNGALISTHSVSAETDQPILSDAATVTSAGRYCWRGDFTSDTTGVPSASDSSLGECFTVNPVTPGLDTQAVASPVNLGQAVQDNATLGPPQTPTATQPGTNGPSSTYPSINPTTPGAPAGGKITFTLLKADCTTLATGTGTNPQDVTVSGDGTYGPVSFTPDAAGTYHWKAQYTPATGDPNNLGSTHNAACNDSDETVIVQTFPTTTTTRQFVYPQDKAKVTVGGGGDLDGSLTFKLYDTQANCQANGATGLLLTDGPHEIAGPSPQFATTDNTTVRLTSDTTVYWRVTYTSDKGSQPGSSSACVESTAVTYAGNDATIAIP
jgi:hypothetical protein